MIKYTVVIEYATGQVADMWVEANDPLAARAAVLSTHDEAEGITVVAIFEGYHADIYDDDMRRAVGGGEGLDD